MSLRPTALACRAPVCPAPATIGHPGRDLPDGLQPAIIAGNTGAAYRMMSLTGRTAAERRLGIGQKQAKRELAGLTAAGLIRFRRRPRPGWYESAASAS